MSKKKFTVHMMRGGAPDKIMYGNNSSSIEYIKHDYCNLTDYCVDTMYLRSIINRKEYILPADEQDIKAFNNCCKSLSPSIDETYVLLPLIDDHVIEYDSVVPKDSKFYSNLGKHTPFIYMPYTSVPVNEFDYKELGNSNNIAIKTTTGSGSRGVWLIDENRLDLGGKYVKSSSDINWNEFMAFAKSEGRNVMIQALIPNKKELHKVNVDFVIKGSKLLGYKWDLPDPSAVFTNWNWCNIYHIDYTDMIMESLVKYLTEQIHITDAIINFEGFSNMHDTMYMIEMNWRFSNSMFETVGTGLDLVECYLNNAEFATPDGIHKLTRYWEGEYYDNVKNYTRKLS